MTGVPLDQLHCPTCGRPFGWPLEVEHEREEGFLMQQSLNTIKAPGRPFVRCPSGHKWTLKTLYRPMNQPEAVLLGDYIGDTP